MRRATYSLLIALPISVLVTVLLFVASAVYGGVCHCETLINTLFPFGALILMRGGVSTGLLAIGLQFPVYATVIAIVNGCRKRLLASALILFAHSVAAVGGIYR